jgi:ssDNA-binding Zn-finger/Zn-ribbon topoisomerase 1
MIIEQKYICKNGHYEVVRMEQKSIKRILPTNIICPKCGLRMEKTGKENEKKFMVARA